MLRTVLLKASDSEFLRRQVMSRRPTRALALRYVAGETLEDGIATARELGAAGRMVTLDYLGEKVLDEDAARSAAKTYLEALHRIGEDRLLCSVSIKPTQMGLHLAVDLCRELLGEIVDAAEAVGAHVTLDMEASDVTEATVAMVETLRAGGHASVGCAVQTYLYRTLDDVKRLTAAGASLRLCKGAYAEPATIAYQRRRDVDANFVTCADWLLRHGTYPRFATHDDRLIDHVRNEAARLGLARDAFEFQMLYGVRTSLQDAIVRDGYRLRTYVPFGSEWYPYFMRRLGERPANVIFFLRSLREG